MLICISGDGYFSLHQQFMVGRSTAGKIVRETLRGIYKALKDRYLPVSKALYIEYNTILVSIGNPGKMY